jgi:hypothetical protein
MTGSVGFGVGIVAGSTGSTTAANGTTTATGNLLIAPDTGSIFMRYYLSDSMSIVPKLDFSLHKQKDTDATWGFAPEVNALFTLLKGASTRLDAGVGLGFHLAKNQAPANTGSDKTYFDIYVPVTLGVEHFFTRWFAMGIWTSSPVIAFAKQGDPWGMILSVNNTSYMGTLTFYTD